MEWFENEERNIIKESARKFARKEITEGIVNLESTSPVEFPAGVVSAGARSGYLAGAIPEELGGMGLDVFSRAMVIYELARAAAGVAAIFAVHESAAVALCSARESQAVRGWIAELVSCDVKEKPPLMGLAFPEPVTGAGPEDSYIWLMGRETSEKTVLFQAGPDGPSRAVWMNSADLAKYARDAHPGSGLDEFCCCRLLLPAGPAGAEELFSGVDARKAFGESMRTLKLNLAVVLIGNAEAAFDQALAYAKERVQTGRVIIEHQEVRRILSAMKMKLEAAKSFIYRVAAGLECDNGYSALRLQDFLFTYCGDVAEEICLDAIQTLGGYGYMKDYGIEKRLRDTKTLQNLTASFAADRLLI